ncbi:glycosyltransferase [Microbacterium sp. SS28]|uniref:glycosyltransferase family 2 protein n=1 Tax=Microbacterium sp. SS28 TaxID=2919948 RepID=UPI001FAB0580|nr:glycosyltransferase [Microbacterium sp. SS28]
MTSSESVASISVVLPCFNAAEFVESAVERLLGQAGPALEVVLVDDKSTDDTALIIARLAEAHSTVRAVLLPENGGVAAAREAAVAAASGDYIWFVDADDEWPDDAASALRDAAIAADADIVCAGATVVSEGQPERPVGNLPDGDLLTGAEGLDALLVGGITGHLWNKLFRRSLLGRIEFTRIRQHSDQAMVAQALVEADRVALLHRSVYTYKLRTGSIIRSGSRRADSLRELGEVMARCVARVDAAALRSPDYLYYRARYNTLSRLKDATSGAYSDTERRGLVKQVRSEMSFAQLGAIGRRGDVTRFGIYTLGWLSPRAYSVVLEKAGGRL